MTKILFVDDDYDNFENVYNTLSDHSHQVKKAIDNNLAKSLLDSNEFDIVITDYFTEDCSDEHLLDYVSRNCPKTSCIILAKNASVEHSVSAMKKGAFDYVACSNSSNSLITVIEKALLQSGNSATKKIGENLDKTFNFDGLIGKSQGIIDVFNVVKKVAKAQSTALITGESGTGKELIARAIHNNSSRSGAPLIVINCGAIPGELLESELFGHEKGAFTGAHRTRIGRFEMANGGTIFLDEVGDMSPDLQVKLLRAIQEQTFERVGGMKSINVDIRILAATNRDLAKSIKENVFREDLYYRLNVIPIHVPPLSERKSDIPLLAEFFMGRLSERTGEMLKTINDQAMDYLLNYNWPGNIRELENLMERLHVLVDNTEVVVDDLPDYITGHISKNQFLPFDPFESGIGFNDAVDQYQKVLILKALEKTNWVKAKAADMLKMNRTTLVEKIKKMKLEPQKEKKAEKVLF